MTTLIPEQGQPFTSVVQYLAREDVYRTAARMPTLEVAPGETQEVTTQVFAGAKEWEAIRDYEAGRRIEGFMPSLSYFMGFGRRRGDRRVCRFHRLGLVLFSDEADLLRAA